MVETVGFPVEIPVKMKFPVLLRGDLCGRLSEFEESLSYLQKESFKVFKSPKTSDILTHQTSALPNASLSNKLPDILTSNSRPHKAFQQNLRPRLLNPSSSL